MALDDVVYPQDPFAYSCKDLYSVGEGAWGNYDPFAYANNFLGVSDNNNSTEQGNHHQVLHANMSSSTSVMQHAKESWDPYSSPDGCTTTTVDLPASSTGGFPPLTLMEPPPAPAPAPTTTANSNRRKRRRTKSSKNKEELENQRMTHITVERNRRKQMNEYLDVLRSLMPPSYVQRVSCSFSLLNKLGLIYIKPIIELNLR